jgi:hypothetical protein
LERRLRSGARFAEKKVVVNAVADGEATMSSATDQGRFGVRTLVGGYRLPQRDRGAGRVSDQYLVG